MTDPVASIRQRLLNHARARSEDFQFVLMRYGLERVLYRISRSPHAGTFVLKGAALFQLWTNSPHRPTHDLDLLGQGEPSIDRFVKIFREICEIECEDGVTFLVDQVRAERIREDEKYEGVRVRIDARLGNARIPIQIDIGFGDAITPEPVEVTYPTFLAMPAPTLRAYPRETVVAEKFHALATLGMSNSRMKDFFDLWTLARQFEFQGELLCDALQATFGRRGSPLPSEAPVALTSEFTTDADKLKQWGGFLQKGKLPPVPLPDVVAAIKMFLEPAAFARAQGLPFPVRWEPPGPWQAK